MLVCLNLCAHLRMPNLPAALIWRFYATCAALVVTDKHGSLCFSREFGCNPRLMNGAETELDVPAP